MASNYPGSLDSFDTIASDKKTSDSVGGRTHRQMHNDLGDAIESVQTELGVNPAGIYDTVAERLAAVDDRVLDGTISDVDINAAADIDPTKIAGTALTRDLVTVDEDNANAMIAGGVNNTINKVASRATNPMSAHVEGYDTEAQGWYGHAEGQKSLAEGKISHAEGNTTICAANDSHAEGNMTVTGRRRYAVESVGSEDAGGGLGVLQFVVIPTVEGDVTSYFPNLLTDDITGRYGAGAQMDAKGNIYASGHTPAVWTGDVPTAPNSLEWAMHSVCILRGSAETEWAFANIAKAVYGSGKTKVYYLGAKPFTTIDWVFAAYSPAVLDGGNGQHAEGNSTSTSGYGAHAEGYRSRAWNLGAHAEGRQTQALGAQAHAEGYLAKASGVSSHAEGNATVASGAKSHAEGDSTTASGALSHAEGSSAVASGPVSHAQNSGTVASGDSSHAEGFGTKATGAYSHAEGLQTESYGANSHAEGTNTIAGGANSHAEGSGTYASGMFSHAEGGGTIAAGQYSRAAGYGSEATGDLSTAVGSESKATRAFQESYSVGKRAAVGDSQVSRIGSGKSCVGAGWQNLDVMRYVVDGRTYAFESMVIGRQTAGTAGAVGASFAYKFQGAVTVASGAMTVLGTISRTLIGRSAGMAGDGLTTGPMVSAMTTLYESDLALRYDGLADTTFYINVYSTVQELA